MRHNNITFKMLRYFITLAEELHFGHAAKRLCISQPPLSQQIRILEENLGFLLFERNNRLVRLTKAGYIAYKEAKKIIAQTEASLDVMTKAGRVENNQLIIGCISSVLQNDFFNILKNIEEESSNISWTIKEKSPHQQMIDLLHGEIDVGFIRGYPKKLDRQLTAIKISDDRICMAYSAKEAPLNKAEVSLKELKKRKIVFLEKKDWPYLAGLYQLCMEANLLPENIIEVNEPFSQLAFIQSNYAIGLTPYKLAINYKENIKILKLKEKIQCNLYMVYANHLYSQGIKTFVELFIRYNKL